MDRLGLEEGEAIEHKMITRAIENAQKKVESRNFDTRKVLLDYDNVMNLQRTTFYGKRREMLAHEDVHEEVLEIVEGVSSMHLSAVWPDKGAPETEEMAEFAASLEAMFGVTFDPEASPFVRGGAPAQDRDGVGRALLDRCSRLPRGEEEDAATRSPKSTRTSATRPSPTSNATSCCSISDRQWKDHLHAMDGCATASACAAWPRSDPKLEYQREGFGMFEEMGQRVDVEVAQVLFKFVPARAAASCDRRCRRPPPAATARPPRAARQVAEAGARGAGNGRRPQRQKPGKVGRNDPCPCGSGKKYKKCHGSALTRRTPHRRSTCRPPHRRAATRR